MKTTLVPKAKAISPARQAKPVPHEVETPSKTRVRAKTDAPPAKTKRVVVDRSATPHPGSKIDTVIALLRAKSGATIDQLVKATGWQKHSVRGAIAGQIKKKLGLTVTSAIVDGVRHYRIGR